MPMDGQSPATQRGECSAFAFGLAMISRNGTATTSPGLYSVPMVHFVSVKHLKTLAAIGVATTGGTISPVVVQLVQREPRPPGVLLLELSQIVGHLVVGVCHRHDVVLELAHDRSSRGSTTATIFSARSARFI